MHVSPRRQLALLLTLIVALLALAPLSAAARSTAPVLTASSPGQYATTTGGCADLSYLFYADVSPAISAAPAVFGFDGSGATNIMLRSWYTADSMGQHLIYLSVAASVIDHGQLKQVVWEGLSAIKCLSDGTMQFAFKPQMDFYIDWPVDPQARRGCGDLGGNARVSATINPTTSAFSFNVYAPVTRHPYTLDDCNAP